MHTSPVLFRGRVRNMPLWHVLKPFPAYSDLRREWRGQRGRKGPRGWRGGNDETEVKVKEKAEEVKVEGEVKEDVEAKAEVKAGGMTVI